MTTRPRPRRPAAAAPLLALALLARLAAAPPAPAGLIDACSYPDDAAAQAAWRPMGGTAAARAATVGGRPALKLPCNFAGTGIDRASWDRPGRIDLSECTGVRLDVWCADPSPVAQFSIYFQSGEGWYTATFAPQSNTGWNTVTIDKADVRTEGRPGGWAEVRTIRVSAWRGGDTDTAIALSNITRTGVLGVDAAVAILRADSAAETRPAERDGITRYTESVARLLAGAGVGHATISDLDATAARLSKAAVVILPLNPEIPPAALAALDEYLQHGGRLVAFFGLHPRLAERVGIRQGAYLKPERPGQFAAMRVTPGTLPGAPAVVRQNSWNIIEPLPVEGASRTLAEWLDDHGRPAGHAAIVGSDNAIVAAHVLLADDRPNTERLLLAMIGRLAPAVWQRAADAAIEQVGRFAGWAGMDDAAAQVQRLAPDDARVRDALDEARRLRRQAAAHAAGARYAEACDTAAAASQRVLDAFCLAQRPEPGEFRAFWCHSAFGVEGMTWDAAVKRLADHGFTAVLPNMLWGGAAFYPSKVLPRAAPERGDQLAECLAACRRHGVGIHVWKVNWNLGHHAPADFVRRMSAAGRLQQDSSGNEERWLCPSHPENQQLELDSLVELARNYDIDGIHFDYIRYPGADHCFCPGCRQRFEAAHGAPLAAWPQDVLPGGPARAAWLDWRRSHITALVAAVRAGARAVRPHIRISAAVFPNWPRDRDGIGQDWKAWCDAGLLDFVCPMDYTPGQPQFEGMVRAQKQWAGSVPCYPGIGASATTPPLGPAGVIQQILATRRHHTAGFTIFNLGPAETRDLLPRLSMGVTARPAP